MTEHTWATFREYNRLQEGVERWQRCECGAARRLLIRNGKRVYFGRTQTRLPECGKDDHNLLPGRRFDIVHKCGNKCAIFGDNVHK